MIAIRERRQCRTCRRRYQVRADGQLRHHAWRGKVCPGGAPEPARVLLESRLCSAGCGTLVPSAPGVGRDNACYCNAAACRETQRRRRTVRCRELVRGRRDVDLGRIALCPACRTEVLARDGRYPAHNVEAGLRCQWSGRLIAPERAA